MHNRVKQLYSNGTPAFGAQIKLPTSASVEVAGQAGLDFVRFDPYHWTYNYETLEEMVRTAYSYNMTPWVRCRNDPWVIRAMLDMGIQGFTLPCISSAAEARAAVAAVRYPPPGLRESNRPSRFRSMPNVDHMDWVESDIIIGCAIENLEGLENLHEIVKVEGVDVISSGPGDLAAALGYAKDRSNPKVREAYDRVLGTALDAGRQVYLSTPTNPRGRERAQRWIERGARVINFEEEYRILMQEYGTALVHVQRQPEPGSGPVEARSLGRSKKQESK